MEEDYMYVTRSLVPAGTTQAPRPQPFDRVGTVLSGTLYVSFGRQVDKQAVVPIPPGQTWTIPARSSCVLWAKEGDVLMQVMGNQPSAGRAGAPERVRRQRA
jgi:hypothetical protein